MKFLDFEGLRHLWEGILDRLYEKQDVIYGMPGDFVVIGDSYGTPEARSIKLVTMEDVQAAIDASINAAMGRSY